MSQSPWEAAVEAVGCVCVDEDSVKCASRRKSRQVACVCRCHATFTADVIDGQKALNWLKTGWYELPTAYYGKLEEALEDSEKRSTRQREELAELKRMRQWKPDNELSAAPVAGTPSEHMVKLLSAWGEAVREQERGGDPWTVSNAEDDLLSAIASLESRLAETADSRDEWQRTADAFGRDIIELHDEIADLRSRLASVERERDEMWKLADDLATDVNTLHAENAAMREAVSDLQDSLWRDATVPPIVKIRSQQKFVAALEKLTAAVAKYRATRQQEGSQK